jgi:hypothetical protein
VTEGHYEVTVHSAGTAGDPHPSAVEITLTKGNKSISRQIPIVIG